LCENGVLRVPNMGENVNWLRICVVLKGGSTAAARRYIVYVSVYVRMYLCMYM